MITDEDFEDVATLTRQYGLDKAVERVGRHKPESERVAWIDEMRSEYLKRAAKIQHGYPPKIIGLPHQSPWYGGPQPEDIFWPGLREILLKSLPADEVDKIDSASDKIIAYTSDPSRPRWKTKGLVVGHVQSGKTTSFTSVIAKAADVGYNCVIVLSGIHNGLRRQTQERLQRQLCSLRSGAWIEQTTLLRDFQEPPHTFASILPSATERKAVLCVVKKNAAVLRKLDRWLGKAAQDGSLQRVKALIIDDEADQATVATPKINPLIRSIIDKLPRCTFIGYTATPFANVLIDPSGQDLYPEDFILNLPRPEGYFGAEMVFGRDEIPEAGAQGAPVDGYDMVRIIPDDEASRLRPKKHAAFSPDVPAVLRTAVLWFWLATTARRLRNGPGHSTMLVHTSMKTSVHESMKTPLGELRDGIAAQLARRDAELIQELRSLWEKETSAVSAEQFGLAPIKFDTVLVALPQVVAETTVVLDNSKSLDRLTYGDDPVTAIAVGGNTLSRGLTLEGLVVSYFIRSANAYDTLMQMGRWFGFRRGYEDLPRIYMTNELRSWFRHLASVEHEVRLDIARFEEQQLTPREFAVRIRTHPSLLVTQKLGAARQAYTSYGGRRVQTRYFRRQDQQWLRSNLIASSSLVANADQSGSLHERGDGTVVWRDVPVSHIKSFLREYQSHENSPDLDRDLLLAYIDKENANGSLLQWSVAVMGSAGVEHGEVDLGGRRFGRIVRARLRDDDATVGDIKTLMSKEDRVVDLDIAPPEARKKREEELVTMRNADPVHCRRGLLLLYPIDPHSPPGKADSLSRQALDAVDDVIGLALVFPGNADLSVQNSYIAVDLTTARLEDPDDPDDLIDNDTEDAEAGA